MSKSLKICLTVFISIMFSFILAEATLRLMPGLVLPDKKIIYKENKEGFRDINHELKALPGVLRIAFIGDSYTQGAGVGIQQTFAALTPKLLALAARIKPSQIEGFNCGMGGANVFKNLNTLKNKAWKYNPDIVVLAFVPNDFTSFIVNKKFYKYYRKEKQKFRFFKSMESFSYLALFLDRAAFQLFSHARQVHLQWLNESFSPDRNPYFSKMLTALNELIDLIAQKHGVVLYFPYFLAANERQLDFYERGLKLVREKCERSNCTFIEVAELLKDKDYRSWWVSKDNHHPNVAAHARVAEKLSKILSLRIAELRKNDLNNRL
jgi:lysophospholipase L1-like esterase